MSDLILKKMREQLGMGLRRSALTSCSKWAESYVRMGKPFNGPLTFKYHPWTREMHDSNASRNVGQKAAQVGYTVAMMNRAFYVIDYLKSSVLYLLPSKTPDAMDFSATKFDPALEMSPYLDDLFTDVKNVGTKRAGSAILYIRGSNSRKGLKSISVSDVICDEYDEMPEHTIPLAQERMSGQQRKRLWLISTPRFPGHGVNLEFQDTTMEHFMFPCPSCKKQMELKHENLVITADDVHDPNLWNSYIKCILCGAPLTKPEWNREEYEDDYAEAKAYMLRDSYWEPQGHKDFENRGFYVNQLYSPTITPKILGEAYLRSLTSKAMEQEYHNSKMGEAHECEGARVSDDAINNCIVSRDRSSVNPFDSLLVTMGVDVGGMWLHYELCAWSIDKIGNDINQNSKALLIHQGKVTHFEELDDLMRRYQVLMCVIDWQPETRQAINFAKRFYGHVRLCRYTEQASNKNIEVEDNEQFLVNAARTYWLDVSLGRFHSNGIELPRDLSLEYRSQVKNIARIYEEDRDGNQIGRYIKNGDDHFAHARNYCEIALPLAAAFSSNSDIGAFL